MLEETVMKLKIVWNWLALGNRFIIKIELNKLGIDEQEGN